MSTPGKLTSSQWVWFTLAIVGVPYVVYSAETQTGLAGYLVAIQLEWFGSSSEDITVLICVLIALACFLPLAAASAVTSRRRTNADVRSRPQSGLQFDDFNSAFASV